MELKDTVDLMVSEDYKDRLKAEYLQVKIRKEKLGEKLREMQMGSISLDEVGELNLLRRQYAAMNHYENLLLQRVKAERIQIEE